MNKVARHILFSVTALLLAGTAEAAYGLKWKPGDEEAVAGAYLTAENAFELRMRQPDGKIRKFWRDFSEPNMLYGEEPWVGEDMGNGMFRILTNPEFKGGRTGFVFQNGHLRRMVLGRKDYQFEQMPYPASADSLESLWPKELTEEDIKSLFGTWKIQDGRLRIGYANPNKGGCLFAEIALIGLAALLLAGRRRWWLMLIGGLVAAGGFTGIAMTESRSSFVAFVVGAAIIVLLRAKTFFTWRKLAIVAAAIAVVVGIIASGLAGDRFTKGLVNVGGDSDSLRVNIMKAAPRMIADAPDGWGEGMSGIAYANWYQAPTEFRAVRTLVNSHLTWLVEFGWEGRVLYLGGVFALMILLFVVAKRGASPLPAALFAALFVAGCFNSVMEAPTLWIAPVASLMLLFAQAGRKALSGKSVVLSLLVGFVLAGVALAALAYAGIKDRQGPRLFVEGGRVIVNGTSADTWVLDDTVVLGQGLMGRELRMYYGVFPQNLPLGIAWEMGQLPTEAKNLIVAGKRCVDFVSKFNGNPAIAEGYGTITFLSPSFAASEIPEGLAARPNFRVIQGELATRLTPDAVNPPPFLTIVPGAELYIPGWMQIAQP